VLLDEHPFPHPCRGVLPVALKRGDKSRRLPWPFGGAGSTAKEGCRSRTGGPGGGTGHQGGVQVRAVVHADSIMAVCRWCSLRVVVFFRLPADSLSPGASRAQAASRAEVRDLPSAARDDKPAR